MFCLLLTTTIVQLSAQTNDIFGSISENLFGKIWKFDQYCNDFRNSSTIERDDFDAELYFNETKLNSFSNLSLLNQALDNLNYYGIKARKSIATICSVNSWGYSDEGQFQLSNLPFDNETECKLAIDGLYESLKIFESIYGNNDIEEQSFQSNRVVFKQEVSKNLSLHWSQLNTFGRAPTGLLSSVSIWPGDYNRCAKLPSTRYCFGAYRSKNWPNETIDLSYAYKIGACLPRSCNSRSITSSKEYLNKIDQLIRFNLIFESNGLANRQLYELIDLYCPPADDSLFRSPFYDNLSTILIIVAIIWFVLIIYATIEPVSKEAALLSYFDLRLSWERFVKVNKNSPQLEGVNALKNIVMFWLVISHVYLLNLSSTPNLLDLRSELNGSFVGSFILQGQHGVPPFFIISGLLVGQKYLIRSSNNGLNVKKFILHRYIRLLPMYLLIYAYIKKFAHLISSGPIWDYGVSGESEARQCMMESWLVPILMLANFIPPFSHCILTGWHISNDFQIYLLLPFLLKIYQKSRFKGTLLVLVSFLATHLYHIWNFYSATRYTYRQFAHEPFLFGPTVIIGRLAYDYVNPFGRFGTYFLGVALADLSMNTCNNTIERGARVGTMTTTTSKQEDIRHEDKSRNTVLSSEKVLDTSKSDQEKSTLQLGAGSCSDEKNVAVVDGTNDDNNNECQDNKLFENLSTDHNNNSINNTTTTNSNNNSNNYQQEQTDQPSNAVQLVKREIEIPVCCPQPVSTINTTNQRTRFKDMVCFFLGFTFVTICVSVPAGSRDLKDFFGPLSKSVSYPIMRFLCEIGWAMIIYSILAKRSSSPIIVSEVKTKFEKKTSSVTSKFFKLPSTKLQTLANESACDTIHTLVPGLGLTCKFFKLPFWDILVKMNYTFILVHFTVFRYIFQSRRQIPSFSWFEYNQLMLFTVTAAYLVSLLIYLTVETPLNLLVNRLVLMFEEGKEKEKKNKGTEQEGNTE